MSEPLFQTTGKCSSFGGPSDSGVAADEGLAFIYAADEAPYLFLDQQPAGTTGLARRLNPDVPYLACRWDYDKTPKEMLAAGNVAMVKAGSRMMLAWPADWGPHEETGRAVDLSPGLMAILNLQTDDVVEVIYPAGRGELRQALAVKVAEATSEPADEAVAEAEAEPEQEREPAPKRRRSQPGKRHPRRA
jgi:hypothetical protein